uniref:Uncharacterized protein n=1 Tax=Mola mola TaxID=94237 RepID=A0A3Q3WW04_MOLML
MFLLNICMCAGLMLSLPRLAYQLCIQGTPAQCSDAEFAPGTNLAGEGFDITKMESKGVFVIDMHHWKEENNTCTLCKNPFMGNKLQVLPLSVMDWRAKQSCSMKVKSKLHQSSEALISSTISSVENNWKVNLDFKSIKGASFMLAGTHSKLAEYSMEKTKNDKFTFLSHSISCMYYSYRVSNTPRLNQEFLTAVNDLPKIYSPENKQQFYNFIDMFGTHYTIKMKLGGNVKSVTSIRQCQAALEGFSVEEVQACLEAEASVNMKVKVTVEAKHCKKDIEKTASKSSFSSLFSDRFTEINGGHTTEPELLFSADKNPSAYKEWLNTLPQHPDIVSHSLYSLHKLLPAKNATSENLRLAISHYILEKGLWKNCSSGCQVGIKSNLRDSCVCQCHNEPGVSQDCCPTRRGMARVIITVQRGTGLWGDYFTATDGYVKVFLNDMMVQRSQVIPNNNNPNWAMIVDLGTQILTERRKLRFEVWDQDNNWDDDLLGRCEQLLSVGAKEDLCVLHHGRLFYKWKVQCAPSLTGNLCSDYKPSPVSQSLRSLYVSRHAHPIPKAILLEMGVFGCVSRTKSEIRSLGSGQQLGR